jgi:hypothetical protein
VGDPGEERRSPDYRGARIGAASALTVGLLGLLFIDAVSSHYDMNPFTIATISTLILALLGLEARDVFLRR